MVVYFNRMVFFGRLIVGAVYSLALVLCCSTVLALSICGSCGYENGDDARFCSHCGASLKGRGGSEEQAAGVPEKAATNAAEGKADVTEDAEAVVGVDDVTREVRLARSYAESGKFELAALFALNAQSLNQLTDKSDRLLRYNLIATFLKVCHRSAESAEYSCPDCNGSGVAQLAAHGLDGSVRQTVATAGMRCRRCGGRGYIRGGLTVPERRRRIVAALEEYRALQQNRGMQSVGAVRVPGGVNEKLNLRSRVALKRSLPPLCRKCMGLGEVACKSCQGRGTVPCRGRGCVNGYIEQGRRSSGGLGGARISRTIGSKGLRRVKCPVCNGAGLTSCEKCVGKGSVVCRSCNGSGHSDICGRCGGEGLKASRRCGGSGKYRGTECPYCHGEGAVECQSCGGSGRKR